MAPSDQHLAGRDEEPPTRVKTLRWSVWLCGIVGSALLAAALWRLQVHGDATGVVLSIVAGAALVGAVALGMVRWLMVVVPPGSIAVFSGRGYIGADGNTQPFRVVTRGASIRLPVVENCELLSTGPFLIEHQVRKVYVKQGTCAAVWLRFRVAVADDEPLVVHAIERFLGRDEAEIKRVACGVLESVVRGEAAEHPMEAFSDGGGPLVKVLRRELQADFDKLGLVLASLEILEATEA